MRTTVTKIVKSRVVLIIFFHCFFINAPSNIIIYVISIVVSKIKIVTSVVGKTFSFVAKFRGGAGNVVVDSELGGGNFFRPVLPHGIRIK